MPQIRLDQADALELAEFLAFLAGWLSTQADADVLDASLARYVGATGYDVDRLRQDLHRFAFLLGGNDGEPLFTP